jgi:hypothetical protein
MKQQTKSAKVPFFIAITIDSLHNYVLAKLKTFGNRLQKSLRKNKIVLAARADYFFLFFILFSRVNYNTIFAKSNIGLAKY